MSPVQGISHLWIHRILLGFRVQKTPIPSCRSQWVVVGENTLIGFSGNPVSLEAPAGLNPMVKTFSFLPVSSSRCLQLLQAGKAGLHGILVGKGRCIPACISCCIKNAKKDLEQRYSAS